MHNLKIGARREERLVVGSDNAINFLGVEGGRVLSTPHMIGYMERTARNLAVEMLDQGWDTVGTVVHVRHIAAAPMGMEVRFTAEVLSFTDRRVQFKVEAFDEKERIGEGEHERAIINVAKFAAKMAAKKLPGV